MTDKTRGPVFIMMAAFLWSFAGLFIKLIPWSPISIAGIRGLLAALVFAIYMRKVRITLTKPVILGALCLAATTVLFVFANKLTTAANAIVLQYTSPMFIIILSTVFLKVRPRRIDFLAAFATFFGITLFFLDKLQYGAMLGNLLALLSGLTFAGLFIINSMPGAIPSESLFLGHLLSGIISIPFLFGSVTLQPTAWFAILFLGIFQLGLAYVFFSIGIKHTKPLPASLLCAIEPILNPVWVLLFTGERPGFWAICGGVVVIISLVLYNILTSRQANREKVSA